MLTVQDITAALDPLLNLVIRAIGRQSFSGVAIDSRQVQPGDLFIALPGEHRHGREFIPDAISRGAAGVIAEKQPRDLPHDVCFFQVDNTLAALQRLAAYWRGKYRVKVVGITGSVGKTTCNELTAAVLSSGYQVLKSEANLNTEIGLPLTLLQLRPEHEQVVLEMGMYGLGDIRLLCQMARPQIGVVTNVGPVHLERLGTLEAIAQAKAELVESLPVDGWAVLNGDDPLVAAMAERTSARVALFGESPQCSVRGTVLSTSGLEGISFRLTCDDESVDVSAPLPGRHNLYNALAAATVGLANGLSLQEVAAALAAADVLLRLRVLSGPQGSTILDDTYNASPASMLAALDLLAELPGRHLALLGDMLELGTFEEEGHCLVGERAAQTTDILYTVGERGRIIGEAAQAAGHQDVRFLASKEAAAAAIRETLSEGDHLLVKASRAMALETVIEELTG
ncbi:MAG: UDP-N-acetylmuramoyl-tripeptide--D-alanyl-D-alanine ligase [Dehalococcoidia bacterium]|nr:UDP-N-acetylmuramoyl-tripeptide--D-alanyl-D-alanine ligase [Dehalococcoidia bacterium]